MIATQPAPSGGITLIHSRWRDRAREQRARLVRDDEGGHYSLRRAHLLLENARQSTWRQSALHWLRDHVNAGIPRWYYNLVLGHDLHISTWATLHIKWFHANERDPFSGRDTGWLENIGLVSNGLVTIAFRDFEIDYLQNATGGLYDDFKYHEVGTSSASEAASQTALTTTTGIARVSGTQVEAAANQYQTVATITADTTETWTEHGIFNASTSGTMMDRSVLSSTVAVIASDTVQFTYTLTKNSE